MTKEIVEHVGDTAAEYGLVIIDGPDGLAATLTVQAAKDLARKLIDAAECAEAQQRSAQEN